MQRCPVASTSACPSMGTRCVSSLRLSVRTDSSPAFFDFRIPLSLSLSLSLSLCTDMASCRRRAPLSDLSNLSPRPLSKSSACPSFDQPPLKPKPTHAVRVLQNAAPAPRTELCKDGGRQDGGRQDATAMPSSSCPSPSSEPGVQALVAMEVDACTPQPYFSKGESFVIYSRRKGAASSDLIRSCPPPRHHLKTRNLPEDKDRKKAVKRGFSAAMLREDVSRQSRRHSLPSLPKKEQLPEDFVAAQRLHFAEVDAFELCEEEGDLSDEG
ncbi:hypothetical protein L7F22_062083 [Adiantum nelumboides]|nr:hypothetical protein [Adiantum nelumboides]